MVSFSLTKLFSYNAENSCQTKYIFEMLTSLQKKKRHMVHNKLLTYVPVVFYSKLPSTPVCSTFNSLSGCDSWNLVSVLQASLGMMTCQSLSPWINAGWQIDSDVSHWCRLSTSSKHKDLLGDKRKKKITDISASRLVIYDWSFVSSAQEKRNTIKSRLLVFKLLFMAVIRWYFILFTLI